MSEHLAWKKDSKLAGVKIDKDKQRVVFDVPVKQLTDVALRALLNELENNKSASKELDETKKAVKRVSDLLDKKALEKYRGIAEKIVEGLRESGFLATKNDKGYWEVYFTEVPPPSKETLIKAIAKAILKNLTYGNLGTLTLRNNKGQIVAKLYILPDGTLADDSWVRNEGWKH